MPTFEFSFTADAEIVDDVRHTNQNITASGIWRPAKRIAPQQRRPSVFGTTRARVTQVIVETIVKENANARVTQVIVETLTQVRDHFNREKNITATGIWRPAKRAAPQRIPNRLLFEGAATYEFGITADAIIFATISGSFTADAIALREQSGAFTADAWLFRVQSGSLIADAVIQATIAGSFTADAVIKREQSGSLTADAIIRREATGSFTADAIVKRTQSGTLTADAVITAGECADPPVWTTPGDGDPIPPLPTFGFTIPIAEGPLHFDLHIDTASTFDSGNLRIHQSYPDQAGWEYWNGSNWVVIPTGGVSTSFAGNEARYTLQTPLADNTWYRRIRAVVVS